MSSDVGVVLGLCGGRSIVDNGIACVASQDCRQGKAL